MRASSIFILLVIFLITACKKEPANSLTDNSNNNSNSNVDTTLLKMYFEIDTTVTSGQDSIKKLEFIYDDKKRIQTINSYTYYGSQPAGLLNGAHYFFYNGEDTLPYLRIDDPGPNYSPQYRDSVFLFYDAMRRLSLDSGLEYVAINPNYAAIRTIKYAYGNNSVSITRVNYYSGGVTQTSYTSYSLAPTSNIQTTHNVNNTGTSLDYQMTFDTHQNPFNITGCRDYAPFNEYYGMPYSIISTSANNVTAIIKDYLDGTTSIHTEETRTYTYLLNGYPQNVIYFDGSSGTPLYIKKGIFIYNH